MNTLLELNVCFTDLTALLEYTDLYAKEELCFKHYGYFDQCITMYSQKVVCSHG